MFPILYPAGILLGSHPAILAGAILSGAIFGDNLDPISDVTIASTTNQRFRTKEGYADIAGTVGYRLKYALIAGGIALVLFAVFGGGSGAGVSVTPVAFLVVSNGNVRTVQLVEKVSAVDNVIASLPELVDKVAALIKKEKPGADTPAE